MRVLAACSIGGAGHLIPLLAMLGEVRDQGDDVLVVGPPPMAGMVEAAGHQFRVGGQPPEGTVARIREQLPVVPPAEATVLAERELFGRLATKAMLPEMEQAFSEWTPDFVLREPTEYSSAVVAHRGGVRVANVAISLRQGEAASLRAAAPALEEHRQGLAEALWSSPYLTRFPASLDPSPFPTTVRYKETAGPPDAGLPEPWRHGASPLVYASFGTVLGHMSYAGDVYRAVLEAVGLLDVRVLLTVGRQFDLSSLGRVAPHVHVERWVDQAAAMGYADLVVCHGGSGTVLGSLAAGVPIVVVPAFADQFENGRRIAAAGAGRIVEHGAADPTSSRRPPGRGDAPRIAAAITDVLGNSRYGVQARRIASEIAATPTAGSVLGDLLGR